MNYSHGKVPFQIIIVSGKRPQKNTQQMLFNNMFQICSRKKCSGPVAIIPNGITNNKCNSFPISGRRTK